jgi:hypothetical protein
VASKVDLPPPKVATYNPHLRYGASEYCLVYVIWELLTDVWVVYLPVPPSVKDRLPIPGGIQDCLPVFYANIPQSIYDWRGIWGIKIENDTSEPWAVLDTGLR